MGVAMQGLSKIFRAPIIKIIRYRAHRAVIFAIAWHLVRLDNTAACSLIGYWHGAVVCLSVCLSGGALWRSETV